MACRRRSITPSLAERRPAPSTACSTAPPPAAAAPTEPAMAGKRGIGLWVGAAVAVLVALAGGYYGLVDDKRPPPTAAVDRAAQDAQLAAEAQRLKDQEELAKL